MNSIVNIAGYKFTHLFDTNALKQRFYECLAPLGVTGSMTFSPEGINLMLAASAKVIAKVEQFLGEDSRIRGIRFHRTYSSQAPFDGFVIKCKPHLVPLGPGVDPNKFADTHLCAKLLKQWLDEGRDITLVDTRNYYELRHGSFVDATDLKLKSFAELPNKLAKLTPEARKKPLVMFCTGGIRCEKAVPAAIEAGFEQVYQLDGGILGYFKQCGQAHYRGDCFVFDQRVKVSTQ